MARAEAQERDEAEIAAELRAREEEAKRREAELEVRRKDALARAEAQERYEADVQNENLQVTLVKEMDKLRQK